MRPYALILTSTLVVLVLTGCQTRTEAARQPNTVAMAPSYRFDPVLFQAPAGTTVTWVNDDNFTHNVHFSQGLEWTSPSLKPGQSATHTFATPGEYDYVCDFHSQNMHGRLVILPQ